MRDSYCYPMTYGTSCSSHDLLQQPFCGVRDDRGAFPRPDVEVYGIDTRDWCRESWCYVDIEHCNRTLENGNVQAEASAYFPGMHFSYDACGSDTRDSWATNNPGVNSSAFTSENRVHTREIKLGLLGPYNSPVPGAMAQSHTAATFLAAVAWLNSNASNIFIGTGRAVDDLKFAVRITPWPMDSSNLGTVSKIRAYQHADQLYRCADDGTQSEAQGMLSASAARSVDNCAQLAAIGRARDVDAIIGPYWSSTATTIAQAAELYRKPMVGYGTTSDALSDKANYPFFSRVTAPDRYQAPYLAMMTKSLGWDHVGLINGDDAFSAGFASGFAAQCLTEGIAIEERHQFTTGTDEIRTMTWMLTTIKDAGVKVIILIATDIIDHSYVLETADSLGMIGNGYIWVGGDTFVDLAQVDARLAVLLDGSIGIFHYTAVADPAAAPGTSAWMAAVAMEQTYGVSAERGWRTTAGTADPTWDVPNFTAPYSGWSHYVWDATVHVVRAAALASDTCFDDGPCLQDAIRNHTTVGATGNVSLEFATGDRVTGSYVMLNVRNDHPNKMVPVGSIVAGVTTFDATQIRWPGGVLGGAIPSDGEWSNQQTERTETEQVADTALIALLTGGFVSVLAAVIAVLARSRMLLRRERKKPVDMNEMSKLVLDDLGIPNPVDNDELGIALFFQSALDPAAVKDPSFKTRLLSTVAKHVPGFAADIELSRVVFDKAQCHRILLAVPGCLEGKTADLIAEAVAKEATKSSLVVGENQITGASVGIPHRAPREVDRCTLTRLHRIGSGDYAEVHKYQVQPARSRRSLSGRISDGRFPNHFSVAGKSVRAGTAGTMQQCEEVVRTGLLREAALTALLEHRNIVGVVGVCTAPRDVPAMVLLEYCEEGNLRDLCAGATPESMTVAERLTFCAQTLQGLGYISSRRIIHRDLAARNVLLDSTMTCKLADFGCAAALEEDGKEYVRSTEQVALRWASIEAVTKGKYSVQSDVWAFGVLTYEVFGCGVIPYADLFDNLTEISNYIRDGGVLGRPNAAACPLAVYEELMVPCFATEPTERPTFGALYDIAVKHGAGEDEEALDAQKKVPAPKRRGSLLRGDRKYVATSVHYLRTVLLPDLRAAVKPVVRANLAGAGDPTDEFPLVNVDDASSFQLKDCIVLPRTASLTCIRDKQQGAVFVDTLAGADLVGSATAILSYAWRYAFVLVAGALGDWCESNSLNSKRQYVWMDVLCWNQHGRIGNAVAEWQTRVCAIGHQLTMLHPWNCPVYATRAWCCFEFWYATTLSRSKCAISIILAPEDRAAFRDRIVTDGTDAHAIDEALAHINSQTATATFESDLEDIQGAINSLAGGFATLDSTIQQHLRRWFVSQGGVKVVTNSRHIQAGQVIKRGNRRLDTIIDVVEEAPAEDPEQSGQALTAANPAAIRLADVVTETQV